MKLKIDLSIQFPPNKGIMWTEFDDESITFPRCLVGFFIQADTYDLNNLILYMQAFPNIIAQYLKITEAEFESVFENFISMFKNKIDPKVLDWEVTDDK